MTPAGSDPTSGVTVRARVAIVELLDIGAADELQLAEDDEHRF